MAEDSIIADPGYCKQRKQNQLFNRPPVRFNLFSIDPYSSGTYTNFDLDMRRKAEILKYSSARMSTQTNNLTKKQTYAGLAKGWIPSKKTQCYDITRPTPTSSCDVPGPAMYLYNDPMVPLYNYATGNRSYSFFLPTATDKWEVIEQPDQVFSADSSGVSFYLQIKQPIDQPKYTYAVSIPIGLEISTFITQDMNTTPTMTIDITNIRISVLYNDQLVNSEYYSTVSDISLNATITGASGETLSILQYIGTSVFPEISLYTEYGYVYTVYMQATVSAYLGVLTTSTRYLTFDTANIISNISSTVANTSINCRVNQITPTPLINAGFGFIDVVI